MKFLLLALVLTLGSAHAGVPQLGGRSTGRLAIGKFSEPTAFGEIEDYQIGDIWGKLPVKEADVRTGTTALQRAARATAKYGGLFGGATGFYMGKFNGEHIMGTNHHVVEGVGCSNVTLKFPFLSDHLITAKCKRIIGHWTDIDFGLIVLDISPSDEAYFKNAGVNFAYDKKIERGTRLLTVGFGVAKNPRQKDMMVNVDDDCKVYSNTEDFRFMGDPDTINPGPYKAWSFAHGCDISHGDSGSAFFNRDTGEMIGIVWTAATPKDARVRTRTYLDHLDSSGPEIWTKLGYTVPASKIHDHLESITPSLPATDSAIVEALIK